MLPRQTAAALVDQRQMPSPQRAAFRMAFTEWLEQLRPRDLRLVEFVTLANSSQKLPPSCVPAAAESARSASVESGSVGVPRCGRSCLRQRSLVNTRSSKNGYDHHSACHRRSCCLFIRRRPRRRSSTRELRLSSPMPLPSIVFSSEPLPLRDKAAAADFPHGVEQRLAIHQTRMGTPRDR